ncbi:hypothetical protein L963_1445 [Leuconostoc mesenteroides subsp. cremoris T26]|nr:hypothetical protein L963_1445 [Leuconostoc mesenteroides subsp. cremoris T26]
MARVVGLRPCGGRQDRADGGKAEGRAQELAALRMAVVHVFTPS